MRTRMNCVGCSLRGSYVRADTEHHIVYLWDDLRVPLCDYCHFWVTACNTMVARVRSRKLTDQERWQLWSQLCQKLLDSRFFDPQIYGTELLKRGSAVLKIQIDAMKVTLKRLNIGGSKGAALVKYVDELERLADSLAIVFGPEGSNGQLCQMAGRPQAQGVN